MQWLLFCWRGSFQEISCWIQHALDLSPLKSQQMFNCALLFFSFPLFFLLLCECFTNFYWFVANQHITENQHIAQQMPLYPKNESLQAHVNPSELTEHWDHWYSRIILAMVELINLFHLSCFKSDKDSIETWVGIFSGHYLSQHGWYLDREITHRENRTQFQKFCCRHEASRMETWLWS